jgi:formiminotetrahydrofolate cyclodeaminase
MTVSLWQKLLEEVRQEVASTQPAPAGVATAAITAAFGLSLLMKVLRITGKRADLLDPAQSLLEELLEATDADVAAVRAFIQTRDGSAMNDVPLRAARAPAAALELCREARGSITGLIAADVRASEALLEGASAAIATCIAANQR